jgi:cytoskeletal protein CcmA (bactofilin family)
MFGRKKERDNPGKLGGDVTSRELSIDSIPPRPGARLDPPVPAGARTEPTPTLGARSTGEPLRRLPDITAPPPRRGESRLPLESEGKRLHVGREIVLTGEIKACDRLIIEGRIEATLTDIRVIDLTESGVLKGSAQIETAEIAGRFEGELTVRGRLHIRSTGRVQGTIRYGSIEIERGGIIGGQIEALPPTRPALASVTPPDDTSSTPGSEST